MTQPKRMTTPAEVEKIKELSANTSVKEIERITGVSKAVIIKIQENPKYKIVNPYRKYNRKKPKPEDFVKVIDGMEFFDFDKYADSFIY